MGKHAMDWYESADFLEAAERHGQRAHVIACLTALHGLTVDAVCSATVGDLSGEGDQRVLTIPVLAGTSPVAIHLTPRAADAVADAVGSRRSGPLLLDDDGRPLSGPAARRVVNTVARSAGLGHRLDRSSTR